MTARLYVEPAYHVVDTGIARGWTPEQWAAVRDALAAISGHQLEAGHGAQGDPATAFAAARETPRLETVPNSITPFADALTGTDRGREDGDSSPSAPVVETPPPVSPRARVGGTAAARDLPARDTTSNGATPTPKSRASGRAKRERILRLLADRGELAPRDIASALSLSKSDITRLLRVLAEQGAIVGHGQRSSRRYRHADAVITQAPAIDPARVILARPMKPAQDDDINRTPTLVLVLLDKHGPLPFHNIVNLTQFARGATLKALQTLTRQNRVQQLDDKRWATTEQADQLVADRNGKKQSPAGGQPKVREQILDAIANTPLTEPQLAHTLELDREDVALACGHLLEHHQVRLCADGTYEPATTAQRQGGGSEPVDTTRIDQHVLDVLDTTPKDVQQIRRAIAPTGCVPDEPRIRDALRRLATTGQASSTDGQAWTAVEVTV